MAQRFVDCPNNVLGEIARGVKMLSTRSRTKRPREALLQLAIGFMFYMFSIGGSFGAREIPPLYLVNPNRQP